MNETQVSHRAVVRELCEALDESGMQYRSGRTYVLVVTGGIAWWVVYRRDWDNPGQVWDMTPDRTTNDHWKYAEHVPDGLLTTAGVIEKLKEINGER